MKKNARLKSRNTKAEVQPKRKESAKKHFALSKYLPKNKRTVGKIIFATLLLVLIGGAIPFPYAYAKDDVISFSTENEKHAGLELGESKTIQEGRNGKKTVDIEAYQSLWSRLLGSEPINQKEVGSTITEEPITKIIADGTRKYQYMLCSDGSSRYYTDEQFKDENTGFTSKSDDYCKENGQGEKTALADSADGRVNAQTAPPVIARQNEPVRSGCNTELLPIQTDYQYYSHMPKGTRQVASEGTNGRIVRCHGEEISRTSGVNRLVFVGTGKTDAEIRAENEAAEIRRQQEQAEKQNHRRRDYFKCVDDLRAQGHHNPDGQCRQWFPI